jgi:enoyl-CoA hydratase
VLGLMYLAEATSRPKYVVDHILNLSSLSNVLVSYEKSNGVAMLSMDDGKANVMTSAMLRELHSAFDQAEKDGVVVLLTSARQGIFSAGFDTKILARKDPQEVFEMVRLGAELAARVLAFPHPVVTACSGHAFPMGALLLLASDIRVGADGPYRIGLNEVAIGIPVPSFGLELARHRLLPAYLQRTALTGEMFSPVEAKAAGFLDHVVPAERLQDVAGGIATELEKLNRPAHASTKERLRRSALTAMRTAIDAEITLENYQRRARDSSNSA